MGTQKVKPIGTAQERKEFLYYLLNDIKALDKMVADDIFEKGIVRIGAEQELCIVNDDFRPSNKSLELLDKINDDHFTTEIAVFNIEANFDPLELKSDCFSKLEKDITNKVAKAEECAKELDNSSIILSGIVPSLRKTDIDLKNMTPLIRYQTINSILKDIRGDEFKMLIKGVDELYIRNKSILLEAFNTSFQVHLQIPLNEIVDKYNWAQAIAGPVLSVMCNSPLLLGRELWSETRIAVFQQSIDTRSTSYHLREQKPRVSFGTGWVKNSITDVYKDDITRHQAIITSDFLEDSLEILEQGKIPKLRALSLNNSTIYQWNRLCYGVTNGKPHFRIENRYIPSGPTIKDEVANTLFWVGVMQGMPNEYKDIWKQIPFKDAQGNFIKGARTGIDSYFNWFGKGISARKLVKKILLPIAKNGLKKMNIDEKDINHYLGIIKDRVKKNQTGSKWAVRNYRRLKKELTNDEANITLTKAIYNRQKKNIPVSQWDAVHITEGLGIANMYDTVRKVMTTEIFVAQVNDPLVLLKNIMQWKGISHLPIVDKNNKFKGVVTYKKTLEALKTQQKSELLSAADVMDAVTVKISPETPLKKAEKIMQTIEKDYVPITENEELIGFLTQKDLERVHKKLELND